MTGDKRVQNVTKIQSVKKRRCKPCTANASIAQVHDDYEPRPAANTSKTSDAKKKNTCNWCGSS